MSEVQATFTVDGVSFTKKKDAMTYAAIKARLEDEGFTIDFVNNAMEAYLRGLFTVPKKPRAAKGA